MLSNENADQTLDCEPLSAAAGVPNPDDLYRLLRLAVGLGFLGGFSDRASGQVKFRNNRLSAVLREDHPNSMKHMVRGATVAQPTRL